LPKGGPQLFRKKSPERHQPFVAGVLERQFPRVQKHPRRLKGRRARGRVEDVADKRTADCLHVNPDLVRAAGMQAALDQRAPFAAPKDAIIGDRASSVSDCGHAGSVGFVSADREIDRAAFSGRRSEAESEINFLHAPFFECFIKTLLSQPVSRYDHQPGGCRVEPVDDAGTFDSVQVAKLRKSEEQPVNQRPAPVSRRGVYDKPSRFVHDDDVSVAVYCLEGDVFRLELEFFGRGDVYGVFLAGDDNDGRFDSAPVRGRHAPLFDQPLRVGAADAEFARDGKVQAMAGHALPNSHGIYA